MTPEQEYVLNTIAAGEAPGYDTLYGGHKFKSYASHPAIPIPIGNSGLSSTAAGRYQLLKKTWDSQAEKLGLKDFSPENQDAAAWNLANETYTKTTGRNLDLDAKAHSVEWDALVRQWPSLRRFANPQAVPGAAGIGAQPQVMTGGDTPEIFSQLPGSKGPASPSLIPVDYDPFQGASK